MENPNKVKIGDFGLVKYERSAETTEEDGYVQKQYFTGSKLYTSPEQRKTTKASYKTNVRLSTKVDIYALGIILFELLYPFPSDGRKEEVNLDDKLVQLTQNYDFVFKRF